MAAIVVMIELDEGQALPLSLEVLGEARRIASALGATLEAAVLVDRPPRYGEEDLITLLAGHGADKALLVSGSLTAAEPLAVALDWSSLHPHLLEAVADRIATARLILFGATASAHAVAPRMAERIGALYLSNVEVEVARGALELRGGARRKKVRLDDRAPLRPVIATVPAGRYRVARGDEEIEVEVLSCAAPSRLEPPKGQD